jgi:SAM-dependent methyltransferase
MNRLSESVALIREAQIAGGALSADVAAAIDVVVKATAEAYSRDSDAYAEVRATQPWECDAYMTRRLLELVRSRIVAGTLFVSPGQRWRLLDVGAGYGRDVLRFLEESDVEPIALENAAGFVAALRALQAEGALPHDGVVEADMRDMTGIASRSFHCVRNHAVLHHLPVVGPGLGADAAVSECRRVLIDGGVFYAEVKAGVGISMIDTREGLGGRFFQLFTPALLSDLLARHSLTVVHLEEFVEHRAAGDVPWIFALAVAA